MTTRPIASIPEGPLSIQRLPSFPAAALNTRGPYWRLSPAFARLRLWLETASVGPTDYALALFFDDPAVTPAELGRYTVCYPVSTESAARLAATPPPADDAERSTGGDTYEVTTFPAADAVVVEYAGPAAGSPAVYARLERWIAAQGLETDGPPRERYLAEPGALGKGMMHVEVQQPVVRRA